MSDKNYKEALAQLSEFINKREELSKELEECIDKSIVDRTLPFDYKEMYVQLQQDLLDMVQEQIKTAKDYYMNNINNSQQ